MTNPRLAGLTSVGVLELERLPGVAGWEEEPKRERCHFCRGDGGESTGEEQERDVDEEDDAMFEVSSAPEDVTS